MNNDLSRTLSGIVDALSSLYDVYHEIVGDAGSLKSAVGDGGEQDPGGDSQNI